MDRQSNNLYIWVVSFMPRVAPTNWIRDGQKDHQSPSNSLSPTRGAVPKSESVNKGLSTFSKAWGCHAILKTQSRIDWGWDRCWSPFSIAALEFRVADPRRSPLPIAALEFRVGLLNVHRQGGIFFCVFFLFVSFCTIFPSFPAFRRSEESVVGDEKFWIMSDEKLKC